MCLKNSIKYVLVLGVISCWWSCQNFLEVKPDEKLTVPSTLKDIQSLLDNHPVFTRECNAIEISSDDFTVTDVDLLSLSSDWHRRVYRWEKDYLFEEGSVDWNDFAQAVYYANSALEHVENIKRTSTNGLAYDNIQGSAKFIRARRLFQASLVWTLGYNKETASNTLGLPLRLNTNFNEVSYRSSLKSTFEQIVADLKSSVQLLPEKSIHVVRPSKGAAYALLARVYLYMNDYVNAGAYADSCLILQSSLMDYNDLNVKINYPVPAYNEEIIASYILNASQILNLSRAKINPEIYEMYDKDDLRKTLFFNINADGSFGFKGRYSGGLNLFAGLATDEIYLIRAEALARQGNIEAALNDLNYLLKNRWKKEEGISLYVPTQSDDKLEVINKVLVERRKELIFRGLRWYDIKRLNEIGGNIKLERKVDGELVVLPPNDPRFALPIPEDIISLSGMMQNYR